MSAGAWTSNWGRVNVLDPLGAVTRPMTEMEKKRSFIRLDYTSEY